MVDDDRRPPEARDEPERNSAEPPQLADDSPTELVQDERGEVVERLSGGTATLLLAWLIGIGAGSSLLAAWIFARFVLGLRLGADELFSAFGFYIGLAGASGPCILWLTGRAQGHSFRWFALTAAKIALVMAGILLVLSTLAVLVLAGGLPSAAALAAGVIIVALALVLSLIWALAVWSADRYIAGARLDGP